jgi:thermitase
VVLLTNPIPHLILSTQSPELFMKKLLTVVGILVGAVSLYATNPHTTGELLVTFVTGTSQGTISSKYGAHGATEHGHNTRTEWRKIAVTENDSTNILTALLADPVVAAAQWNYTFTTNGVPNDTWLGYGWLGHLTNINAFGAWDISQGSTNVIVGVVDTGIDASHPELTNRVVAGINLWDTNYNTTDTLSHGTLVAGLIVANNNNAYATAAIGWKCRVMPIRVTDLSGTTETWIIANGVTYAADHGCKVVNASFMCSGDGTISAAAAYLRDRGGLFVCAAGNGGAVDNVPNDPNMINVAGVTSDNSHSTHSNYGPPIDVCAPCESITSLGLYALGYPRASGTGTSFAAPIVAGTIALMWSANPALNPDQVEAILKSTATDLGDAGWDQYFGYGEVNASAAVLLAKNTIGGGSVTSAPPVLGTLVDKVLDEKTILQVSNVAVSDGTVTYKLQSPPLGATIYSSGIINWTPNEAQGPGVYTITTIATDNHGKSATNSFGVTVNEVNTAPILPNQITKSLVLGSTLTVNNAATDLDIPNNPLYYSLLSAPTGCSIDVNGTITFTPNSVGTYTVTTIVNDGQVPPLRATNQFNVSVTKRKGRH